MIINAVPNREGRMLAGIGVAYLFCICVFLEAASRAPDIDGVE